MYPPPAPPGNASSNASAARSRRFLRDRRMNHVEAAMRRTSPTKPTRPNTVPESGLFCKNDFVVAVPVDSAAELVELAVTDRVSMIVLTWLSGPVVTKVVSACETC